MPTSRKPAVDSPADEDSPLGSSFEADALDDPDNQDLINPRDSALAALLVTPASQIADAPVPPPARKPDLTGFEADWSTDGEPSVRAIVWADVYARMFGEDRRGARRGDVLTLPDNKLTASHFAFGHLVPE